MPVKWSRHEISSVNGYQARSVTCPYTHCRARPQRLCRTKSGSFMFIPHRQRAALYLTTNMHIITEQVAPNE